MAIINLRDMPGLADSLQPLFRASRTRTKGRIFCTDLDKKYENKTPAATHGPAWKMHSISRLFHVYYVTFPHND